MGKKSQSSNMQEDSNYRTDPDKVKQMGGRLSVRYITVLGDSARRGT
jgi:hypothetical protein